MNVHQHLRTLLQARQDILLDLCYLDVRCELLNLQELAVGLRLERLLILALAKREFRTRFVAISQCAARCFGFLVHENIDSLLVLEETVSLNLEIEDCPARAAWLAIAIPDDGEGSYLSCSVTLPLLCLPPISESLVCLLYSVSRFRLFQDSRSGQEMVFESRRLGSPVPRRANTRHRPKQEQHNGNIPRPCRGYALTTYLMSCNHLQPL